MHLTPLFEQYQNIKNKYKDVLLLFRVGDFYEFYFEDAKLASSYLGITLTAKTIGDGVRVPLAGVPVKAADGYIAKLVKNGFKVAICDQLEPATKGKKLVARDVTEVITPGTVLRPSLLDETKPVSLAACLPDDEVTGVAFCDLTSGDFSCGEVASDQLAEILLRREVREVVIPEGVELGIEQTRTQLDGYHFIHEIAYKFLTDHFRVVALDGFGIEDKKLAIAAAGALLYYVKENQKTPLSHIDRVSLFETKDSLYLDSTTRRNLEILDNIHGDQKRTLLGVMDHCVTPFGRRRLRREICEPMVDKAAIEERLDGVEELKSREFMREELRNVLRPVQDVERIASRLACRRIMPRELVALKDSLCIYPTVRDLIESCESAQITAIHDRIGCFDEIVKAVEDSIVPDPPATLEEGGIIKEGFSRELDELREIARGGKKWLLKFEEGERERTSISSLKVSYNSVFGYFIEVTKANLQHVPKDYIRKQTLANAERYYTAELKEFEEKILSAEEKSRSIEYDMYVGIRERAAQHTNAILETTRAIALLDVIQSFAHLAAADNYCRPVIVEGAKTVVKDGRHPVVERILEHGSFIPNDTLLDSDRNQIVLITGPNMAGKSTYLRQVALITLMAQLGSYVPAKEASIGLVDKIFTRIGASDDISRGVSTFLAEMMETANILNNVSEQSLVILDEVGRGTSTYDGLALAWSVVEYLHGHKKPRTLFATHFHELTRIEDFLTGVKNFNFLVKEWGDEVIFLRKLSTGPSDQSYGIQVARLAGLPDSVIRRAKEVLRDFEEGEVFSMRKMKRTKLSQQDLFFDRKT